MDDRKTMAERFGLKASAGNSEHGRSDHWTETEKSALFDRIRSMSDTDREKLRQLIYSPVDERISLQPELFPSSFSTKKRELQTDVLRKAVRWRSEMIEDEDGLPTRYAAGHLAVAIDDLTNFCVGGAR